jgi:hypothetical protein
VNGGDVLHVQFTPDGERLVFLADLLVDERYELFSVPAHGSGPTENLSQVPAEADVLDFICVTPTRVLFRARTPRGRVELFGANIDGTSGPENYSGVLARTRVERYEASPASGLVLFAADPLLDGTFELCAAPARPADPLGRGLRPEPPRRLAPGLALDLENGLPPWIVAPSGAWALGRARRANERAAQLFLVPTFGTPKPVWIDGGEGGVQEMRLARDAGGILYRAALRASEPARLYWRPTRS